MDLINTDTWKDFNMAPTWSSFWEEHYRISLPEEFIREAITNAGNFFGLPRPYDIEAVTNQNAYVKLNDHYHAYDDIIGYDLNWFREFGIHDKDSFRIIMTHEAAHRYFQNGFYPFINPWEEELACDFLAAIHSCIEGMDPEKLLQSIETWSQSTTHPYGTWRSQIIKYGLEVSETFTSTESPDLNSCLNNFTDYLQINRQTIHKEFLKERNQNRQNHYSNHFNENAGNDPDIQVNHGIGENLF